MEVNDELVEKLAHLSRLEFNSIEKAEIKNDLQRMIVFVDKLNELNLDGVEPQLFMSDEVNVLRGDESFEEKLEYIRQNPVRRGLVTRPEDYRWMWVG